MEKQKCLKCHRNLPKKDLGLGLLCCTRCYKQARVNLHNENLSEEYIENHYLQRNARQKFDNNYSID